MSRGVSTRAAAFLVVLTVAVAIATALTVVVSYDSCEAHAESVRARTIRMVRNTVLPTKFLNSRDDQKEAVAVWEKRATRVSALADGIMVSHGRHWWVDLETAARLAEEAVRVTELPEYEWLDPVDLLAVAAAESDFRTWRRCENGKSDPKGYDCGITQVRATIWRGGRTRAARALCDDLVKSSRLAFEYAARELTSYRGRYCKKHVGKGTPWRLRRCLFNAYKSGPRYCRTGHCGRYWIRVHCFRMGIRLKRRPRRGKFVVSCRTAMDLRWIWKVYR